MQFADRLVRFFPQTVTVETELSLVPKKDM